MAEKDAANEASSKRVWPGKLNVVLIGIGVLAFGLIIVDRMVDMLSVDDLPDTVETGSSVESEVASGVQTESDEATAVNAASSATTTAAPIATSPSASVSTSTSTSTESGDADTETIALQEAQMAELASSDSTPPTDTDAPVLDIDTVFGGRLVFVSSSAPMYVVTEDERRIDVGGSIDAQTTLSGLTSDQVILEREGNLVALELPAPSAN